MFNPNPTLQVVPLFDGHECLVIDNALQDPHGWAVFAVEQRARFQPSGLSYPGLELWLAEEAMARYADFFAQHLRSRLGGRRTINIANRLSLVTLPPESLAPRQWLCHRDNRGVPPGECLFASVIYLFEDPALGGTSFYRPRRSSAETEGLVEDCRLLDAATFRQRHPEVRPGYMVQGNDWFEHVVSLPARWNRAIFYDGGLFHSGDIHHPERMSADPTVGRLTMNAFIRCRLKAQ